MIYVSHVLSSKRGSNSSDSLITFAIVQRFSSLILLLLSRSVISLITSIAASSGEPFGLMNTLLFVVAIDWILFCFLRKCACLAMSAFFLGRCSLTYTLVRLSFLPCLSSAFFLLSARKENYNCCPLTFVFLRERMTCISVITIHGYSLAVKESNHLLLGGVHHHSPQWDLVFKPMTIRLFLLEYCSRSGTHASNSTILSSFFCHFVFAEPCFV